MQLANKRVLVTGAAGFIGGHIAERLVGERGAVVRAFVREGKALDGPAAQSRPPWEIARGDVTDWAAVERAMPGCDVVIHCAAKQSPPGTRAQFIAENAGGVENLARAALACGIQRFIHLSTINVHGYPPPPACSADSPLCESGDAYSDSKIAAERVAWKWHRENGLPLVIVRPACTYGPRGGAWTLGPLRRVRSGKRVLVGRGDGLCNPAYIDNLVDLVLLAAENDQAIGQAFIGSDGVGVPWREFYGAYARMLGVRRLNAVPLAAARLIAWLAEGAARVTGGRPFVTRQSVEFYSHRVVYDIAHVRRILGYEPRVSFVEGMRRTERWLKETGNL